ncbi:MAG: hypothetical protein ACLFWL_05875 [Candidatus Brocadiia bacterium]
MSSHNALYGLNPAIGQKGTGSWEDTYYSQYYKPLRVFNTINEVPVGSGTHLISDNGRTEDTGQALHRFGRKAPTSYNKPGPRRHKNRKGGNIAFIDGHVIYMKKELVYWTTDVTSDEVDAQKRLFSPDLAP